MVCCLLQGKRQELVLQLDLLMYMSLLLMGKPQALLLLLGQQNHNQLHNLLGQQLLDLLYSIYFLPVCVQPIFLSCCK